LARRMSPQLTSEASPLPWRATTPARRGADGRQRREDGRPHVSDVWQCCIRRNGAMSLKFTRLMGVLGVLAMVTGVLGGDVLRADEPDQEDRRPPPTLPQGFESSQQVLSERGTRD